MQYTKLIKKASDLRKSTFLAFIKKGEAHLGGSFSMIEMLITLFEIFIKKNDKFILSKSHSSFPLCILLREKGLKTKLTTHESHLNFNAHIQAHTMHIYAISLLPPAAIADHDTHRSIISPALSLVKTNRLERQPVE